MADGDSYCLYVHLRRILAIEFAHLSRADNRVWIVKRNILPWLAVANVELFHRVINVKSRG